MLLPLTLHYQLPDFTLAGWGHSHADLRGRGVLNGGRLTLRLMKSKLQGHLLHGHFQELSKGTSNLFSWSYTFAKLAKYCYFDYN